MNPPRAWLLNLDAERELIGGARIDPFAVIEQRPPLLAHLEASLVPAGDIVVMRGSRLPAETRGVAWCPTPRARQALEERGATLAPSPSAAVLRAVNHRAFLDPLALGLPGSLTATRLDDAKAKLVEKSPTDRWLLKHPLGFAGRSRRTSSGPPTDDVERFVVRCLAEAGAVRIEPLVERTEDLALHGYLREDGVASFGAPTRLIVSGGGSYGGTERIDAAPALLLEVGARVAVALQAAGYFGPFGIDAFHYRDASGRSVFHPLCELNARYTMGWGIGFGDTRPDSEDGLSKSRP